MARAEDLPLYKDMYSLTMCLIQQSRHFPRLFKYTLGQRLIDRSIELTNMIRIANMEKDESRLAVLKNFAVQFGELRLLIRISQESDALHVKPAADIVILVEAILRQLNGWTSKTVEQIRRQQNK